MTTPSSLTTIVAIICAAITMAVSWRVVRDHPILSTPAIPIGVGGLAFLGLRRLQDGWADTILIGYIALPLALALLLLWVGFQKVRRMPYITKLAQRSKAEIRCKPKSKAKQLSRASGLEEVQRDRRRQIDDEDSIP